MTDEPFWKTRPIGRMTPSQWESLCDGCGRCCLLKLENLDAEVGADDRFAYTCVACKLLDCDTGHCRSYVDRLSHVPDCLVLTPDGVAAHKTWLPETCAYRRLAEGRDLPPWHPLRTGDPGSTRTAGYSVAGWCWSEQDLADECDLIDHTIAPLHLSEVLRPLDWWER